jgi:CrcB protein
MADSGADRVEAILLIAVGGFVGATGRFGVGVFVQGPLGTLLVNVVGCFGLGTLLYVAKGSDLIADRVRIVLATGALSSFTTYSTFAVESFRADPSVMLAIVLATYTTGIGAVLAGREAADVFLTGRGGSWP